MGASTVIWASAAAASLGMSLVLLPGATDIERLTLAFPPDVDPEQVETWLGTVAGLPARSRVVSVVEGQGGRLGFALSAATPDLATLRASLQGFAPGLRLAEPDTDEDDQLPKPRLRARLGWRGSFVLLRGDQRELATAALLGVLRSAGAHERLQLRVRLRPIVRPKAPPYRRTTSATPGLLDRLFMPLQPLPGDQLRQVRNQYAGPLLSVRIEVLIWAASRQRARQLLSQVVAVLRSRSGPRGRFSVRSSPLALPTFGTMIAPAETVPLLGWPLQGPDVPGLTYARSPQRLPDEAIAQRGGRCWGTSTWPGMADRALHQPVVGSLSHALILGPTGSGKSSLLAGLLLDDIAAGRGALLLDMKGDTALDVLERIPTTRQGDVVVLDPADSRPLPGLKSLHGGSPELSADLWVGLFRNLFADSWGVRSERYLRLGVQTLALDASSVITELPRVFSDPSFRQQLLSSAGDPLLASSWASFEALSAAQQAEHLAAPLGKVQDVIGRRVVRSVLGQLRPKTTIAGAIERGQIVIVRLSPGQLGGPTAQLLGGLSVYEIYQAVMRRQALAQDRRRPYGIYIDEPAVMRLSSVPLDSLYELARGLHVGITTATQSVHQLPPSVGQAVVTNAATIASFRTGHRDAVLMARELPMIDADSLQHLGQYEIALRLGLAHGRVSTTATARTRALPLATTDPEQLRDQAAEHWGVAAEDTEAALHARWQTTARGEPDAAPLGRRRRSL
jgi:hypothetical protein